MDEGFAVRDVMTTDVLTCHPEDTVKQAAKIMSENKAGSLLVKEDRFVGIITERDIVTSVADSEKTQEEIAVKDIMTHVSDYIVTATPDEDIYDAMAKMKDHSIRRLPVVTEEGLHGIITSTDLLRAEASFLVEE